MYGYYALDRQKLLGIPSPCRHKGSPPGGHLVGKQAHRLPGTFRLKTVPSPKIGVKIRPLLKNRGQNSTFRWKQRLKFCIFSKNRVWLTTFWIKTKSHNWNWLQKVGQNSTLPKNKGQNSTPEEKSRGQNSTPMKNRGQNRGAYVLHVFSECPSRDCIKDTLTCMFFFFAVHVYIKFNHSF